VGARCNGVSGGLIRIGSAVQISKLVSKHPIFYIVGYGTLFERYSFGRKGLAMVSINRLLFAAQLVLLTGTTLFSDDLAIVRNILETCGLSDITAESVSILEDGRVVSLDLKNRDITKDGIVTIPEAIGTLTELRVLGCSGNSIETLPAAIGNLVNLQKLDCGNNRIVVLPAGIGNCINLTVLDLRHNQLAAIPPEIENCKKLKLLQLWGNKLTTLNEAVIRLPALEELYLKDNRLTSLPASIVKLNLRYFDVMGNKLCETTPAMDAWIKKKDQRYKELQKCW
jgi:hypothetical protein